MEYKIDRPDDGVIRVRLPWPKADDEIWLMLSSDRHFDSVKCNRNLMKQHLELALQRNALIVDVGDFFDAMQGRYDPRRSYEELRSEYKTATYLDDIVVDAAKFFAPYAKNFLMISRGNHDQTVLKNSGTDIISNLVHRLNTENDAKIALGGYGGWIKFILSRESGESTSINLKYYHGAGGDAPVTKGTIATNRQAVYLPDADIVVNGHSHNNYILPLARERVTTAGKQIKDLIWFVRTPSYADGYGKGISGFEVEKWMNPKPLGCVWVKITQRNGRMNIQMTSDLI